ncbi:hypothetical protein Tco_0448209 [Tanacetum coccineum]
MMWEHNNAPASIVEDLRQAVVLFELAWLDFHKLVLMDDLWSIVDHDFMVEMNATSYKQCLVRKTHQFLATRGTTFLSLGAQGSEDVIILRFCLFEMSTGPEHASIRSHVLMARVLGGGDETVGYVAKSPMDLRLLVARVVDYLVLAGVDEGEPTESTALEEQKLPNWGNSS